MVQNVLVTGAEGALGSSVANRFLSAGCSVTGTYLREKPAKPEIGSVRQIRWIQMDLGDPVSVKNSLQKEKPDTLIHCAGGFRFGAIDQLSDKDLNFLLDSNLKSAFYLVREILPAMKEKNFGRIVFVSAKATQAPGAGVAAYAASKSGINMLTLSLAEEVKKFNINVNAVLPSIIDTPANRKDMSSADFTSWVTLENLSEIIFTLTQPISKPIHGALIPVSGRV